ncbi:MAG: hypothetical protein GY715_10060 [Planctomycetes bacterium]|nr:hypothetical protein [Planctomycetota bacterium]
MRIWTVIGTGAIVLGGLTTAANAVETAYWRFEGAGGTTVVDSGPNGLDGTLNALPFRIAEIPVDPVPGTGALNTQSLDLNWQSTASGGRFNVVDPTGLLSFGDASFTIEAWVRLDHVSDTSGAGQRQHIGAWGPCGGCPEDLNGNGAVDFADILVVIAAWGPCP